MPVRSRSPFGRGVVMQRIADRLSWLSWILALVLAVTLAEPSPALSRPRTDWSPPATRDVAGVPVTNVDAPAPSRPWWTADKAVTRGPADVSWPTAGSATVDLAAAGTAGWQPAGGLPVKVTASGSKPGTPGRVNVTMYDRAATARTGRDTVLFGVGRSDGLTGTGTISVRLSYAGFASAFGGDWATRLRLVRLPECALTTPDKVDCRIATPVPTVNNPVAGTLTGDVTLTDGRAQLLSTASGPTGDNGSYAATGLSPAGTWQVSNQTGAFAWSVPLRTPPSTGGPAPALSIAYSSGSVDGRTGTSNNQGGWIGDGWDMWPGYIERTYASCADDNPSHQTGDQCWFSDNATLSLSGHAGELIRSGNTWRLKADDGTRAEKLTDGARANGDNDNEYWKVTTPDGTQYFFGYHRLPGWTSANPVTDSTFTTPVYGNNSGEPCYDATFANAWCTQAWRWNLDYVVDPNANTMAFFYSKETGAYGRHNNPNQRTTYDRGGYLDRIEYGMRAGSEYAQAAPLRVHFITAERCLAGCWTAGAWASDPVPSAWRDTPWDQYCKAAPCNDQLSPTFWSARRLTKVTTQIRNGANSYADVESWTLRHEFLNAGSVEGTPMWLRGLTHTGHVTSASGSVVTDPEIVFDPGAEPLANRVDGPDDGRTALYRWRIKAITTESGAQILVSYSPASDCSRANPPNPETNTTRCMPAFYAPAGTGSPTLDWFHKYVVTRIDLDDLVTDQPNTTTFYDYLDAPAWHYNTDEMTKDKFRTWGDFRGYGRVRVRNGDATGPQTAIEYRYLRGMDGDRAPSQPGAVRDVWVGDSWGGSIEDHEALNGFQLQQIRFNGAGGPELDSTLSTPWRNGPTATQTRNGVTSNAWMVKPETTRARTALAAGGFRISATRTAFNADGFPSTVDVFGNEAVSGDETCTRTTYARNDTTWMIDRVAQTETLSGTCASAATPATPATVLSRSRKFYDSYTGEASFGAAPTNGNVVRTEELDRWSGNTPVYVATAQTAYDGNGRVLSSKDARDKTTSTTYTTANGGLVIGSTVTNPLGQVVSSVKEPAWDLPTRTTDPNGLVTELTYDGLGRLIGVWLPGRNRAAEQSPNLRFSYLLRNSGGPTAVTTETLLPPGNAYKKSVNLYDGLLRQRQTQTQAASGGRLITETFHNTLGEVDWTSAAYYDQTNTSPGTSLGSPQGQIPSITSHRYDGSGRETASIMVANGVEKWRTTTVYGGDRTSTTPPDGGVATTAITDIEGRTVELRQYHSPASVGGNDPATYDATRYDYDLSDRLRKVTDPAGNVWSYTQDLRGRQTSATDPDKGTTTTTYDPAGNVLTTTSPLGTATATLAHTYDDLGRRVSLRDGSATGPKRAEWRYDTALGGVGKLAKSIRWIGTAAYESRINEYDAGGRPTSTTVVIPSGEGALCAAGGLTPCEFTTAVSYRVNGATHQTTLPAAADLASEKLTFGYNDIGEQTTLLSASQIYVNTATYDKLGQLTQRVLGAFGSRIAVTSNYDEPTRRLLGTNVVPELKPEAAFWSYEYDASGNIKKIAEAPAGQAADTQCFEYDYLTRLTNAWTPATGGCTAARTVGALGGPAPYWHSWTYDMSGNRRTEVRHAAAGDSTYTSSYPDPGPAAVRPHAVSQVRFDTPGSTWTRGYTYDNAGNTATRPTEAGNQQTLSFDAEGRLSTVVEAGATTSHVYDADGNRLIRRDATGSTLYLPGGTEVRLAPGALTPTATRYYTHLDTTLAVRTAAGLSWIVGDHHNTAEVSLDKATLAVVKRRSLPFGAERGSVAGWPAAMDKGFVGGTKDGTGLTHLGLREYDPTLGRFISVDPIVDVAEPHQLNPYNYAHHNPVTIADPTGQWPSFLDKAASKVASAVSTAANAVVNTVAATVESIKQDPLKFAVGLAVGIAATAAIAAVCATGVGCLILAGAVAGAAAAGAEYGVDVAQGDREFSAGDLAKEMAIGGATGAATAGLGAGASKLLSGARGALGRGGRALDDVAEDAAGAGRQAPKGTACPVRAGTLLSFDPRTPVMLASGVAVPIADVRLGDEVLATDPYTATTIAAPVVALFANADDDLADLSIVDSGGRISVVHTTQSHPFWSQSRSDWVPAGNLVPGEELQSAGGAPVTVAAVVARDGTKVMYNLAVSDVHSYYVLVGGHAILVHNRPDDGGWYGALQPAGAGNEINHMPAKWSLKGSGVSSYSGPAVRMDVADHRVLNSTGSSAAAKQWRWRQRALVRAGKLEEAMFMDINDIRSRFGTKYDDQIKEMLKSLKDNKAYQRYKAKFATPGC